MLVPGRTGNSPAYRYGFNGKEKDDELKGIGNSYDFGARMLDPRVGRWFKIDPLSQKYPYDSPYIFSGNSPISIMDPDGERKRKITMVVNENGVLLHKPRIDYVNSELMSVTRQVGNDPLSGDAIVTHDYYDIYDLEVIVKDANNKTVKNHKLTGIKGGLRYKGYTFTPKTMLEARDAFASSSFGTWEPEGGIVFSDGNNGSSLVGIEKRNGSNALWIDFKGTFDAVLTLLSRNPKKPGGGGLDQKIGDFIDSVNNSCDVVKTINNALNSPSSTVDNTNGTTVQTSSTNSAKNVNKAQDTIISVPSARTETNPASMPYTVVVIEDQKKVKVNNNQKSIDSTRKAAGDKVDKMKREATNTNNKILKNYGN